MLEKYDRAAVRQSWAFNMSTNNNRKRTLSESNNKSEHDAIRESSSNNMESDRNVAQAPIEKFCRSVNHYTTEVALKKALLTAPHEIHHPTTQQNSSSQHPAQQNVAFEKAATLNESLDSFPSSTKNHLVTTNETKEVTLVGNLSQSERSNESDTYKYPDPNTSAIELCDWRIPHLNSEFIEQSIENEIRRLLVLKSYNTLDIKEGIPTLNRLANLAGNVFSSQFAFVGLMDLGRLFFIGSHGSLQVTHVPRKATFCSYTMLVKNDSDVFVLPDALADDRTCNNPFAVSGQGRFYAGTPLVGPEGVRLGTFCVLDSKPRPNGMPDKEKDMLRTFAKLAVDNLVARKALHYQSKQVQKSAQMLACAANDLLTPLTGVQLSLSLLREDICSSDRRENDPNDNMPLKSDIQRKTTSERTIDFHTSSGRGNSTTPQSSPTNSPRTRVQYDHRLECLATATTCANIMVEICETLRPNNVNETDVKEQKVEAASTSVTEQTSTGEVRTDDMDVKIEANANSPGSNEPLSASTFKSVCCIPTLAKRLRTVIDSVPKQVPVIVTVSETVPNFIVADELPIFRAALNLLAASCDRANTGKIALTISVTEESGLESLGTAKRLLFECVDSGPTASMPEPCENDNDILTSDGKVKMKTSQSVLLQSFDKSSLSSVSALARSMGGDFGVGALDNESRGLWKSISGTLHNGGNKSPSRMLSVAPTTKFWFKIPLFVPDEGNVFTGTAGQFASGETKNLDKNTIDFQDSNNASRLSTETAAPDKRLGVRKTSLVIDDSIVIRKTLNRALAGLGYDCLQAENGLVGLEQMKVATFDVVLCDFLMPVMDGMDCVREYREWESKNRPGFHQYIVGMSAHATPNDGERAVKIGMNKYVPKPIFLQQLKKITEESERFSIEGTHVETNYDNVPYLQQTVRTTLSNLGATKYICLIGAQGDFCRHLEGTARENGFFAISVDNGEDLLQLLKARNWAVVLAEESILGEIIGATSVGQACIQIFRDWEKLNRVHRQKNVYMICPSFNDSLSNNSTPDDIDLPAGTDGILGTSVDSATLSKIFRRSKADLPFVATDIVTS